MFELRPDTRVLLVSASQTLQVVAGWIAYRLRLTGNLPNEDETTSSRVGRAAIRGNRYALALEAVIDWLAVRFGDQPGHCRRNVEVFCRRAEALADLPPTS